MDLEITLDRFEGNLAILLVRDDETTQINVPISLLPAECEEGDILDIRIEKNTEKTKSARKRTTELLERIKSKKQ